MFSHDVDDADLAAFFQRLRDRGFDKKTCFLCAGPLEHLGASEEHVIPRWAQNRYDLWDQRFELLNQTTIPYRQMTVPCCEECNKYRLQPIEVAVSAAVSRGPEAVRQLGHRILFLWLGKILYGILYKELFLALSRTDPTSPPIVDPDWMRSHEMHLFFLQEARGKVETVDFCPGSIFVFRMQLPRNIRLQWDFCDNVETLFVAVRMGEVGLIGVLGDGGAQQSYEDIYDDIRDFPLHPIQFRELCAIISYRSTLATRTPTYLIREGAPHTAMQLPIGGVSTRPLFNDWDHETYARYLAMYTKLPLERVHPSPDQMWSWLHDFDGRPKFIPFNEDDYMSI